MTIPTKDSARVDGGPEQNQSAKQLPNSKASLRVLAGALDVAAWALLAVLLGDWLAEVAR